MNKKQKLKFDKLSKEIKFLQIKKKDTGLSDKEENKFADLNHKIDVLLNGENAFPKKFFTKEFNDKLSDVIKKSDKLINKIINNEK